MTNRRFCLLFAALLPLLLLGCVSGYKQFYRPAQGVTPEVIARLRESPPPAAPVVERSAPENPRRVLDSYAKRGYIMIGSSMFNSGRRESEEAAVQEGRTVGADLVLILNPRYTGSVATSIPITVPKTTTSYSTGTATAYGPGGTVTAYGNGTTTTYGSATTYVPMTVNRVDYGAVYFVKMRLSLGVFTRDLNDSERQEIQSNKGTVVRLVVDNSPAFDADILPGDIITSIDGVAVSNTRQSVEFIREHRGEVVALSILRRGQRIEKSVQLNP